MCTSSNQTFDDCDELYRCVAPFEIQAQAWQLKFKLHFLCAPVRFTRPRSSVHKHKKASPSRNLVLSSDEFFTVRVEICVADVLMLAAAFLIYQSDVCMTPDVHKKRLHCRRNYFVIFSSAHASPLRPRPRFKVEISKKARTQQSS